MEEQKDLEENIEEIIPVSESSPIEEGQVSGSEFVQHRRTQKEYEEAREYLGIIMDELEDTKHRLATMEMSSNKKKKNVWKGIAVFEMLCLLGAGSILGFRYLQERNLNPNEPVMNQGNTAIDGISNQSLGKTYRYVENLSAVVEEFRMEHNSPFQLSVEKLFGYEYLCFSNDNIKVYYRNEFEEESFGGRFKVLLDNGTRFVEYDWDYDLSGDLKKLSPVEGSYAGDGSKQLLFLTYDEDNTQLPSKLTMVDTATLMEHTPLFLEEHIEGLFHFSYSEEMNNLEQVTNTLMTMNINSASYTYHISKEDYINAVYYEQSLTKFKEYASLEITEDSISLNAPLYLSDHEFLGEITSNIVLSDGTVGLSNLKYGAYVEANQDDPGSSGVITPRTTILKERVIINGHQGRRYLIPLLETVELNTNDWNNLKDENGYKVYYEDGVKASIMGIDVSKYQGVVDWEQVKASGVDYAILRLGFRGMNEGTLELDPMYLENIEAATKAGMPVGVYFFSQAITTEEAIEEAKMVLNNIKGYDITYPIVFDTEVITTYNARANNLTRQERTDIAIAFCEEIKAAGYKPMIYANTTWMIMGIDLAQLTAYDKWFAFYGNNLTFPYKFQMLQYSDTGRVPGIEGNVDLNISFIDYSLE